MKKMSFFCIETLTFPTQELIPVLIQSLEGNEHVTTCDYPGKDGPALLLVKGGGVYLNSNSIDREELLVYAAGYSPDAENIEEKSERIVFRGIRIQTIPINEEWLVMAKSHDFLKINIYANNNYDPYWE